MTEKRLDPRTRRRLLLLALFCALYTALVILFNLGSHEFVWANCEEDMHFRNAYWLAHGHNLLLSPNWPPLYYYLSAAFSPLCNGTFRGGHIVSALACGVFLFFSTLFARRLLGDRAATAALLITALNASVFEFASSNCTDMLFAALAAAALYTILPTENASLEQGRGRTFGAGCILGLATATRYQGYVLLIALAAWLLLRSELKFKERLRHLGSLVEGFLVLFLPISLPVMWLSELQASDAMGTAMVMFNLTAPKQWAASGILPFVKTLLGSYGTSFLTLVIMTDLLAVIGLGWLIWAGSRKRMPAASWKLAAIVILAVFFAFGWFRAFDWSLRRSFLILVPILFALFARAALDLLALAGRRFKALKDDPLIGKTLLGLLLLVLLAFNANRFFTWYELMSPPTMDAYNRFEEQWRSRKSPEGLVLTNSYHYLIPAGNAFHSHECCLTERQFRYWIALLLKPNPVRFIFLDLRDGDKPDIGWQRPEDYFSITEIETEPGFAAYFVEYSSYPDDALTRLAEQGIDGP